MKQLIILVSILVPLIVFASPNGPHQVYANNPPNNWNCTQCHNSFPVNSGDGTFAVLGIPDAYEPGESYTLSVTLEDIQQQRWGFQLAIQLADNSQAGQMLLPDSINTQSFFTLPGIGVMHTNVGTYAGTFHVSPGWTVEWVAPEAGSGTVGFYASGNAANYGTGTDGDYIYTFSQFIDEMMPAPITVNLTPYGTPIVIPVNGGQFGFNIGLSNTGTVADVIDIWTYVTLPNGSEYGPIINFPNFTINPGTSPNRDRTQNIPANAPEGNYMYDAYIGEFPNEIIDEDHFEFMKVVDTFSVVTFNNWVNTGESFSDLSEYHALNVPNTLKIESIYPNPFNSSVKINFSVNETGLVNLQAYDISGRLAANLTNGFYTAGEYDVEWQADGLSSGIYYFSLSQGGNTSVKKALYLK